MNLKWWQTLSGHKPASILALGLFAVVGIAFGTCGSLEAWTAWPLFFVP